VDATDLTPLTEPRAAALRQTARDVVRGWLAVPDPAAVEVGPIGASAIAAAAEASRRLAAIDARPADAGAVLDGLRRLAERTTPEPPARWNPFRRAPEPVDLERELAGLVAGLEDSRDTLTRAAVRLAGERERIAEADARLEEAAHLIRTLVAGAEAAAREIGSSDPVRAAALRGPVAAGLTERLGDVLTQLAVTRQVRLSLALIADGHEALAGAIDRARATMVSALRTAALAGRAMGERARLEEQAGALGRAAEAAGAAVPERQAAVARAIDDAIAQIGAAATAARGPLR
jgi:hypothetical protein